MGWWIACVGLSALLSAGLARQADATPGMPGIVLVDGDSAEVLFERDADASHPTAGLSQLMVLLLSLEQAALGTLPLDAPVTIGPLAAGAGSGDTRIPLHTDRTYILGELLQAMVISAAADAEVAVAEAMAGSLEICLDWMNARAQRLGMTSTHYGDLTGERIAAVPGTDATTARDVARLARALVAHATVLHWASLSGLPFDQGQTLLRNANPLLGTVRGVDGLLVTSTQAAPRAPAARGRAPEIPRTFNVVATAKRQSLRLIAVHLGGTDSTATYRTTIELLEWGFTHYERLEVVRQGDPLNVPVRILNGATPSVTPVAGHTVSLLTRRDDERNLRIRYQLPVALPAPVTRQQVIGELVIEERDRVLAVVPAISPRAIAARGLLAADRP